MEKNKYYTPELSEFHVGFEFEETPFIGGYELTNNPIWHKVIYQITEKAPLSTIESMIHFKHARVKYLDKEDIESFGLKLKYENDELLHFQNDNVIIVLSKKIDPNKSYPIEIKSKSEGGFLGYIKNKSELKILLEQLNIIS